MSENCKQVRERQEKSVSLNDWTITDNDYSVRSNYEVDNGQQGIIDNDVVINASDLDEYMNGIDDDVVINSADEDECITKNLNEPDEPIIGEYFEVNGAGYSEKKTVLR